MSLFLLLNSNLSSDVYWRTPIIGLDNLINKETINLNSSNISIGKVTVFLAKKIDKKGLILDNKNYIDYLNTLDIYAQSILGSSQNVVKQGSIKTHPSFLYTFYLNYCYALIINNETNIIMLHGQPIGHPGFENDLKEAKRILSKYSGEIYLISHQNEQLLEKFNSERKFNLFHKHESLIASIKAFKENEKFFIKAEFHPNTGVTMTNYDKLIANKPWGPLSVIDFLIK